MIEHTISSNSFSSMHPNDMIWQTKYLYMNLADELKSLYTSTSLQSRKLYNVSIYRENTNQTNKDVLVKNKLQLSTKRYISWCYLALNWEYVSIQDLDTFLFSLPNSESQPQQIRLEPFSLKITKFNKSLKIDLLTYLLAIEDNNYFLDSYDRKGKYQNLPYYPSLCQLTVNNETYRFDGLIRLVESCQQFMAVVTYNSVYIIGLKEGGKVTRFNIKQCIDVKWSRRGLYYLQKNGELGLLQRQVTYIPLINTFSQQATFSLDFKEAQFVPQRIAVTGNTQTNQSLVLLATSQSNPRKVLLQMVNHPQYGRISKNSLVVDLKEVVGDILFKNLLLVKGELRLIVVSGRYGKVEDYHQYRFGTV